MENQSLGDVTNSMKKLNDHIEKITYYTLDGAIIPEMEKLIHRDNIPFIMSVKK